MRDQVFLKGRFFMCELWMLNPYSQLLHNDGRQSTRNGNGNEKYHLIIVKPLKSMKTSTGREI